MQECRSLDAFVILLGVVFIGSMMPALAEIGFSNSSTGLVDSCFAVDNNMSNFTQLNNSSNNESVKATLPKLPLSFIENQGQLSKDVKFVVKTSAQTVFFAPEEVVFALSSGNNSSVVHMAFEDSRPKEITGENLLPGKANFFIGNDSSKWVNEIPTYGAIRYVDIYPGIDLVFKGTEAQLKHEFIVSPGANPAQIVLNYSGQDNLSLSEDGFVLLRTVGGNLTDSIPVCYQIINGSKTIVDGRYRLIKNQRIRFEIGSYDKRYPLVIDPVLIYSTYLGGSGLENGNGIAMDNRGNTYVTGYTYSNDFPTNNPMQVSNAGDYDVFITKIDAAGTALVYSTYLGGIDSGGWLNGDRGYGIAVDENGNAYVTGGTESRDFPIKNPIQSSLSGIVNSDAFITKINAAGSELVYSTYLGGPEVDFGNGIAVDSIGNAYITGVANIGFPTKDPIQASIGGVQDAFVTKIGADGSALIYSSFLGGSSNNEHGNSIAVDVNGNAYITGDTSSADFPTKDPIQALISGTIDAFVTKINATGSTLDYSTYLGGSGGENGKGIAVDSDCNAYITGYTSSANFPTKNPLQPLKSGSGDVFITKINATGSTLDYSTYLGGSGDDLGCSIAVDGRGNAYVTGYTSSANFPLKDPLQLSKVGGYDIFVTRINTAGSMLDYSTYLGGSVDDKSYGIAVDGKGNAYVIGYTDSANFPILNPYQGIKAGGSDAFVVGVSYSGEWGVINIKKYTNGEDADLPIGPSIPVGGPVTWRYSVTTTSNVPIHNVIVTDSISGVTPAYVSGDTNDDNLLTSDESWIYEAKGTAVAGQYSNVGYVTGETPSNQLVADEDPSYYYGESANPTDVDIDETASEKWIDPYSSNTDDKEARIWYEIAPGDFSGQLEIEIKDKNGNLVGKVGPISVTGGRHFLPWDGRTPNEYVNQANNPYYISLILKEDEKEVARSANQRIWVGRPVILLHGIWRNKEYMEGTDLYSDLSKSFNVLSVEYNGGIIGSMVGDIKQYAGKLDEQIDLIKKETGAGKVDIVAHSMGGLVARWYIQKFSRNDVGKLIMIGTPNHGSEWANAPKAAVKLALTLYFKGTNVLAEYSLDNLIDMLFAKSSLAALELTPHSGFLQDLNNNNGCAYFVEKGEYDDEISASSRYAVLSSKYSIWTLGHKHLFGINSPSFEVPWKFEGDFMVPIYSAKLSDVSIWAESDVSHGGQDKDPAIIDQTRFLLQQQDELIQYSPDLNEQLELDANGSSVYWTTPIEYLILPGEVRSYNIKVDTSSTEAQFMIVWENGTINVTLTAPNGTEIEIPSEEGYAFCSVQSPDPGNWTAKISPISIPANGTNITIQAFISNPLFIGVNTEKTVFNPQESIKISAYLGSNESGFAGALVMANISKPDDTMDGSRLYDDGLHNDNQTSDGIYANEFTNTSLWGVYKITISARGDTDGNNFEREAITTVWVELYPDLTLNTSDIYFSNSTPIAGENITLTAEIHNIGDADAENSSIRFYDNDPASGVLIGEDVINVSKGSFEKAEAFWNATPGQHEIYVCISPYNSFLELNYSNNVANKSINVSIENNSCISGTKFNDSNSNATRDPGEAGLSGWIIRLTRPDGTTINATTDANGAYKFENLTSGTYRVSEIRQSNWTQTYPAWLGDHIINITDGSVTGVDFGNNYLPVPDIPFPPAGPASGIPGAEYSYTTSSTDPSGYQIAYTFDWGDGSNSTTGLFDSGAVASAAHIWNSSGVYQVRAMATNSKGASSGWSDALEVDIAAGIIPDQIGVSRNGGLYFDANGDGYWTTGDTMGWFGATGDLPVAGDWDGDGKDEIAVFRNGGWYFDANGDGYWTAGDTTGWFGATGDLPAAGDWDGDGKDEIAVFRNGGWYFDANGDRYWTEGDTTGWFGATGDLPAAGDWDNNGKDEIAVFRNGGWYFDANGDRYWTTGDATGWFGATGDLPAAGDWDNNGKDEIAVFRNGGWYFDANGDRYWTTGDTTGWFGAGGDRPVAGQWGSLSSLALDHDKPQLDLDKKVEPFEEMRQKRAALKELQEESRDQVRRIKLGEATPN